MITLEEAQHFVRRHLVALTPVDIELADALGCVAGEELTAQERVPGFSNSAMDGYALRAIDTASGSARLRVTGSVMAGDVPTSALGFGEAMRVMTGAPIPDGADCVCMIEEIVVDDDRQGIFIARSLEVDENVRHPGSDVDLGQVIMTPGTELGPAELGVLASQGFTSLRAFPRPRVGVLSTGNELAQTPGTLPPGKIRDTNRPMLLASLRQSGFEGIDLGIIRDDPAAIEDAFRSAIDTCDAVISTGGVSVGDVDHVKSILISLCEERARWMQVAIKPGKPFTFGVAGPRNTPLFGLPGNPVSTLVGFEMYVRPSLRFLGGHRVTRRPTFDAVLDCPITRRPDGKLHLVHVKVVGHGDGRLHVRSAARQGSHLISAISGANAIALVPDGVGFEVGQIVPTLLLSADGISDT